MKPIEEAINAVFEILERDHMADMEIKHDPEYFERRGDKAFMQSGYGPMDDRSAVAIDVRAIVSAARE